MDYLYSYDMNEASDSTIKDQKTSKPRTRSPAYPAISLAQAIEKGKIIWGHEKRNAASMAAFASDLEINPKSSSFLLAVSALKKYGLLEEVEGTKERMLKLTAT